MRDQEFERTLAFEASSCFSLDMLCYPPWLLCIILLCTFLQVGLVILKLQTSNASISLHAATPLSSDDPLT